MKASTQINKYQTIFLNNHGLVTTSNETLFPTAVLSNYSTLSTFPFIESIFDALLNQPIGAVFQFKKVKTNHSFLPGIYDFTFVRLPHCNKCKGSLIWTIFDRTSEYMKQTKKQQIRQEKIIWKELKSLQ